MRFLPNVNPKLPKIPKWSEMRYVHSDVRYADSNGTSPERKEHGGYDDSSIPRLTWASFFMGILVSMVIPHPYLNDGPVSLRNY